MNRAYNFSAGPAGLPTEVLEEAQRELLDYKGSGVSIMESSHRGKEYKAVQEEAEANIRTLMGLDDDYAVLFLQGGATGQFAMVPMNLLGAGKTADYVNTGAWAKKAIKEAKVLGNAHIAADTSESTPACMPELGDLDLTPGAAYLHITSNETIAGTQWKTFPTAEAPLVADMSSDILSRSLNAKDFGLIYAGAQKNLGPAGVTLVIMLRDLADKVGDHVPTIYRYKMHMENDSMYNTPPCFPIYILMLVTRWLLAKGGIAGVEEGNRAKADKLYQAIDATEFYRGTAAVAYRSDMNVTFRLPSEDLEAQFVKEATAQSMQALKGHRSVGGIRASIYNSFPAEGVDALVSFMKDFEQKHG